MNAIEFAQIINVKELGMTAEQAFIKVLKVCLESSPEPMAFYVPIEEMKATLEWMKSNGIDTSLVILKDASDMSDYDRKRKEWSKSWNRTTEKINKALDKWR